MSERETGESMRVIINRGKCPFHPDENFACVKRVGPFPEGAAHAVAEQLREILHDRSEEIYVAGNGDTASIPQMCQDCRFRHEASLNGNPQEG